MCGIYGTTIAYTENQVQKKLERTNFRGPDRLKHLTWTTDGGLLTLGHNRLSIIDLDSRSDQPFSYQHLHVVFNGEIYNFQSIKKELTARGYSFRTTSDTEVVCAAYLAYGEKCVSHFNGMFAFVIYDEKEQLLFGATDRLGQKPFYYYHDKQNFEFSSQLASIQLFNKDLTISKTAITQYFAWNYIPEEHSIFNEIKKIPPAHRFVFDLRKGELKKESYWSIDYKTPQASTLNYEDGKKQLENILTDATKIRLFADVPVGVFLSGGVDSSLISALATKTTTEKIKTFSIKFNDQGFNESEYAEAVARHLNTDHQTILCNENEGIHLIENLSYYFDEPFADSSAIPSMLLAKHTRKKVTVALSGDGADELFLGYHRYDWLRIIEHFMKLPFPLRKLLAKGMDMTTNYRFKVISKVIHSRTIEEAYVKTASDQRPNFLKDAHVEPVEALKYLNHDFKDIFQKAGNFDLFTYLPWDINAKVDRATMAYSLEARSPFLDYRVVELSQKLPTNFKYQKKNQKRILKDILYQHVPKEIFDRPKGGFEIPFKEWFRKELKPLVLESLSEKALGDIPGLNIPFVLNAIDEHMAFKANNHNLIWKLLVLKQWLKFNGKGYSIN